MLNPSSSPNFFKAGSCTAQRDTVAALAQRIGVPCTLVGQVVAGQGIALEGEGWALPSSYGYRHF